jgi:DNA-binding NarL/FixJ family response regulator
MIKVLLVDDQEILTQGLKMLLGTQEDIEVIGQCANGQLAVAMAREAKPDVVLMDIQMPVMNGIEALKIMKDAQTNMKVIMLTTFHEDDYISDALHNGAAGYLLKDTKPMEIAEAIRTVYRGDALISPQVATKLIELFNKQSVAVENSEAFESLTERESDIVRLVGQGMNNKEISGALFISEGTVKNHLTKILEKLCLRDRTQVAIYALKNGLS